MGEIFMDKDDALKVYKETGWDPFGYFEKTEKPEAENSEEPEDDFFNTDNIKDLFKNGLDTGDRNR